MTLLEEFIFALSKTEREKLRPLQFKGAKRRIFLKILTCRDRSGVNAESLIRANKLTRPRYNQLASEMLAACYRDVTPRGGTELLLFLGTKQLFRHFFFEMRRQEAALLIKPKALAEYYARVTIMSECFMVPPKGNEKILEEGRGYNKKYVKIKEHHPDDHYLVRITKIDSLIAEAVLSRFDTTKIVPLIEELEEIFKLTKKSYSLLCFVLSSMLVQCFMRIIHDREKAAYYFTQARATMAAEPRLFAFIKELFEVRYELETASRGMIDLAEFKNSINKRIDWKRGFPLTCMYEFFPIILRSGDLGLAKKYIQKHFPYSIELVRSEVAIYYWQMLMFYHLYTGNNVEAESCMRKALTINRGKARNIRFEVLLKRYEPYFPAMKGDPVLAEDICIRNIKRAFKYGAIRMDFLKTLAELMKHVDKDRAQGIDAYKRYRSKTDPTTVLSFILEKIYDKYYGMAPATAER